MTFRLLILGGSSEGFALAAELSAVPGLEIITSFAGRTKTRRQVPGRIRVGGFGGVDGLAAYLRDEKIDALIDAAHPFADKIKGNADKAAKITGTPILHIMRPAWQAGPGDNWREAVDMDDAARLVPDDVGTVFLTVGRTELAPFVQRRNVRFLARIIDPPQPGTPIGGIELLQARGPFYLEDERRLLTSHAVGCLVTKNSGGDAASPKLEAARELQIPVIMVGRPSPPQGPQVSSVAEAAAWLEEVRDGQG